MAKFEKGMPRPVNAGRKKGSMNKPKLMTPYEFLLTRDIEPISHLINLAKNGDMKDIDRARIWMELMSYLYPKPRAEVSVQMDNPIDLQKVEIVSEVGTKIIAAIEKWNE